MKKLILLFCFSLSTVILNSQSACNNEDFEASPAAVYTASNGITGWTISRVNLTSNNCPYNTTTNFSNISIGSYNLFEIHNSPAGFIDTVIGPGYPIYSVFGSGPANGGNLYNPSITNMYGDNFIRIASHASGVTAGCKLEKVINVTSSNCKVDVAFMNVVKDKNTVCCDASAMIVKLYNASSGNTIIPSSTYSISNPCVLCTNTTVSTFTNCTGNTGYKYHPWEIKTIDLSSYMGSNIAIQLTVNGCYTCAGLQYLYTYFDVQCRPDLTLGINSIGNFNEFKVYPNPTVGVFSIDISKEIKNGEIELRNVLGQTVHKQPVKQGNNSVKTENLAKGIYNYTVLQNKEVVSVGKIVIE